jgi:hypothetical protein
LKDSVWEAGRWKIWKTEGTAKDAKYANPEAGGGNIWSGGATSNIFKRDAMSEKWGQKNESSPLRFKRGGGVFYVSDPDISAMLFQKIRNRFCANP